MSTVRRSPPFQVRGGVPTYGHALAALPAILALLLPACSPPAASPAPDAAEAAEAAEWALDRLNRAASAKDVDAFMEPWLPSDSLVYIRHGEVFRGWDAVRENHRAAFADPAPWTAEGDSVVIRTLGPDGVVATGYVSMHAWNDDGSPRVGKFVITATLERRPDGWRIVHAHSSYPGR